MKTLDRYIIRQFLINFVILTAVLMLLIVLIMLTLDLDEFVDSARFRAGAEGGTLAFWLPYVIVDFFYPVVIMVYGFVSGILVVGAMGFTYAQLYRARELVAIVASGVSLYRVALPVLVVGAVLNCLVLPVQEFVIPRLAAKLARSPNDTRNPELMTYKVELSPDKAGALFSAVAFHPTREALTGVTILDRGPDALIRRRITATEADWDAPRGGWRLVGGQAILRDLQGEQQGELPSTRFVPVDFIATDLSPQVLQARRATLYSRLLSLSELQAMANNPAADRALMMQIMFGRFSLLMVNILLLALALPFFLLREPRNLLVQSSRAAMVVMAAWGLSLIMMQVSPGQFLPALPLVGPLISPATMAWLPVILLLPLVAWLVQTIRT